MKLKLHPSVDRQAIIDKSIITARSEVAPYELELYANNNPLDNFALIVRTTVQSNTIGEAFDTYERGGSKDESLVSFINKVAKENKQSNELTLDIIEEIYNSLRG
jgi:hypothetical protein